LAGESVDVVGAGADASRGRMLLRDGSKYLLNPGAVGQPRDGDPRAAFGLVDTGMRSVEIVRVDYPFAETQNKVLKAGLPEVLAQRLAVGR
jgi:diadenosine tetraphosphatase ApaH/serine/threonine PP2A family protein phosphatase